MAVRVCGVLVCLGVGVVLLLGASLGLDAAEGEREAGPAEKKLQERVAILEEIVQFEMAAYRAAKATFVPVLSARRELAQAKLELAKDSRERIDLLQEQVALSTQLEESVARLVELGHTSKVDVLRARAQRLKAEAELAQEQARTNPAKK